ncbi:hypothetical protein L0668_08145 [Paraglaciecola aquimarina]|uniref:DUF432 domain-containing protein n=1 Tax=Paraglaciecola algarum TaxID=3050085 RepID=A0ABS9D556_9ALTE|nr:hypothetical protein [Paraglaciecola sp. G1-23]MCF2948073.1 hypothetical protein [Paraglaciecola sp. G1-23]
MAKNTQWWGDVAFGLNDIKVWSVGDRKIAIQRLDKEWIIWNKEVNTESHAQIVTSSLKTTKTLQDVPYSRHLVTHTTDSLKVQPKLADRSIVARPATSLNVLPGEHVELYISSPLWFSVNIRESHTSMVDIPFWRPSDSWFGSSTMHGELCYAKFTDARIDLSQIEKRCHRAITPILIKNEHLDVLTIDRINLPALLLNLYVDDEQQFWTQKVEITRHDDSDKAVLQLSHHLPQHMVKDNKVISMAREKSNQHQLVKSIKSLLA